jgi:hypothetical protein
MPDEVEAAVGRAVRDAEVKVIVLRGAGRAFCAGYDFGGGFQAWDDMITTDAAWDAGKDFAFATAPEISPTQKLMCVWRSPKPVIAQVHGWCVGGGSDFALCADSGVEAAEAGPILDGLMRNTPEARAFIERAERDGVRAVVTERDGPFGDYSQAPPERRPNPDNVIVP